MSRSLARAFQSHPGAVLTLVLALAALVAPPTARAQIGALPVPTDEDFEDDLEIYVPRLVMGITGHSTVGATAMDDLNDSVESLNAKIAEQGTSGVEYGKFNAGPSFGVGLRALIFRKVILTTEFERFFRMDEVGGFTQQSEITIPASVYTVTAGWNFLNEPHRRFGFGAGIAHWTAEGEQVFLENEEEIGKLTFEGSSFGHQYFTYLEMPLTERLYVHGVMGWRFAKIDDLDFAGVETLDPRITDSDYVDRFVWNTFPDVPPPPPPEENGEEEEPEFVPQILQRFDDGGNSLDYSGFYGRMGFTIYWNPPDRF